MKSRRPSASVQGWLRALGALAYLMGFFFAWRCWAAASEDPARAIGWLTAASIAFWTGRIASRVGRRR
jgi:hypothetical protein